jgi:hypothetical protein
MMKPMPPARAISRTSLAMMSVAASSALLLIALIVSIVWWVVEPPEKTDGRQVFEHRPSTVAHQLWSHLEEQQASIEAQRAELKRLMEQEQGQEEKP